MIRRIAPKAGTRIWVLAVMGCLLLLVTVSAVLFGWSADHPSAPIPFSSLWVYWLTCAGLWLLLSVMVWLLRSAPHIVGRPSPLLPIVVVLSVSLLARAFAIWAVQPRLSDDIWRYIHDGATLGGQWQNPYAQSPAESGVRDPINHPHLITLYQPTSQWVFAALARISSRLAGEPPPVPGMVAHRVFRLGLMLFDVGIIVLLMLWLLRTRRSVWWSVLWAWHPLVISEIAATGHQDVIGIAWLFTTIMLLDSQSQFRRARWLRLRALLAGGAFALAIGVKPVVAPLILAITWRLRRQPSMLLWFAVATGLTVLGLYLPFALMEGGIGRMIETLRIFVAHWAFNSSIHGPLAMLVGKTVAGTVLMVVLLGVLVVVTTGDDLWRTAMVYLFVSLLVTSTVHPWYLLWALALVPIRFHAALWVFSLTIAWSYVAVADRVAYNPVPAWVLFAEYAPVYGILAYQLMRRLARRRLPT